MPKLSVNYSDAKAKEILRAKWSECPTQIWSAPVGGAWLRALPVTGSGTNPCLKSPGTSAFKTQPDGMYICTYKAEFADVIAIEVCGSSQNLNDKRSRYSPNLSSLILSIPSGWMSKSVITKGGGKKQRWEICHGFETCPNSVNLLPVRHLRVLYFIPDDIYSKLYKNLSPVGHEFFCKHASLNSITNDRMRNFLKRMSMESHFHGKP
jgi:hypothetical protein